jgi:predicted HD phosphohydrolase
MQTVSFRRMDEATAEDYELLDRYEEEMLRALPDRMLEAVEALDNSCGRYKVSRKEHSLQSATRAFRDCRSEEYVVAAPLHDVGDILAPHTHGEMMIAVLKPFVSEKICWVVSHHGVFQEYYYGHLTGGDRNARERYRGHQWFDTCAEFCERYDQNCFDPNYESEPLDFFEPMVRRVFAEPRYLGR